MNITRDGETVLIGETRLTIEQAGVVQRSLAAAIREADWVAEGRRNKERIDAETERLRSLGWVEGPDPRWLWWIAPGRALQSYDTTGLRGRPPRMPPGVRVRNYAGRNDHLTPASGTACKCGIYLGQGVVVRDGEERKLCKAHRS